jgi:hypothetical protein
MLNCAVSISGYGAESMGFLVKVFLIVPLTFDGVDGRL